MTGFHERFPQMLGLPAWSGEFFVAFNLFWISVWVLSSIGVRTNFRPAFFPVWFFAIGMAGNGFAHPALAIAAAGYFPGLFTSPVVGASWGNSRVEPLEIDFETCLIEKTNGANCGWRWFCAL